MLYVKSLGGILTVLCLLSFSSYPSLSGELQKAAQSDKGLLLFFSGDACHACAPWEAFLDRTDVREAISGEFMKIEVNIDDFDGRACSDIYQVSGPPAIVIVDTQGQILYRDDESLRERALIQFLTNPKNSVQAKRFATNAAPQHFSPSTESEDQNDTYWVQTGYFGSRANAERMAKALESAGFAPVSLKSETRDSKEFTRVLIGSFSSEEKAKRILAQCEAQGFSAKLYF